MTKFTRQNPPTGFYTYAYLRENGRPYYIGKGGGTNPQRAWQMHGSKGRTWKPPVNDRILFLKWGLTEDDAFAHEVYLIAVYGNAKAGGWLSLNFTDGGEGCSNPSKETRKKIGRANKGRKRSAEAIEKIKLARSKQVITAQHCASISASLKRKPKSSAHKKALSKAADPEVKAAACKAGWAKSPNRGAAIGKAKLQPQRWHHPDHGVVVAPAKEIMSRFNVANLSAVKRGVIKQSKGWTWLSAA